ncbi:hypothetical protein AX15_000586 [Amanita polypyramis BW_CC]|nr:hypothetical protein AX15_000586 [Amanita polypyramis BW_CC]
MGRALFSQNYPTPQADEHSYETWSKSNPFDPDADDFFIDAVYEAFLDSPEYQRQREERLRDDEEIRTSSVQIDADSGVSLSSDSPLLSSRGSPMAVGADDPAVILADAGYASPSEWDRPSNAVTSYETWMRTGRIIMPAGYIPPLSIEDDSGTSIHPDHGHQSLRRYNRIRSTSISPAQDRLATTSSSQPISRRTITITPIDVTPLERRPSRERRPSPVPRSPSPEPLQTPPRLRNTAQLPELITPSPVPTATPRIYSWHSSPTPWTTQSPTPRPAASVAQAASLSPLPNQSARISHSRITLTPVHVLMQGSAI